MSTVIENIKACMLPIEGGEFILGDRHKMYEPFWFWEEKISTSKVLLDSFHLCSHVVTQEEWVAVMGGNTEYKDIPMTNVSWHQVQDFISKLNAMTEWNFRLPTEAEWEFAARGGVYDEDFYFAGGNIIDQNAWYNANSNSEIKPIAKKKKNLLGLFDMSGNVWEWCQDWHQDKYEEGDLEWQFPLNFVQHPCKNPQGANTGSHRVIRGGSYSNSDNECWVFYRKRYKPKNRAYNVGFRLAY